MDKTLSQEFMYVLNNLRKLTNQYHPRVKVHPGEFMMLGAIHGCMQENNKSSADELGVKISELSDIIHSTKPATSKMLKNLEEKGYITRVSNKKDKRIVYIRLSDKGETIIQHAMCMMFNFLDRTIQRLGEEDAKELIKLMNRFYQAMQEEIKNNSINQE